MWIQLLYFGLGMTGLYFGAEWLVRGAARLARSLGMSALAVGLTVVAFGTSSPELVVSGLASARGQGDVALGNVVGSNVLNIALILGLAALLYPIDVKMRLLRREIPLMIFAGVLLALLALDGGVGRGDGLLFLVGLAGYLGFALKASGEELPIIQEEFEEFEEAEAMTPRPGRRLMDLLLVVVGIAGLTLGAHLMVTSALHFARALGIPELVIGITVVSIGTSLPELATVLVAAFRKESDIALGNAVGSNIFNILAILGVAAVIRPIPVDASVLRFEVPAMIFVSVLLVPFTWTRLRLDRWEGAVLLACYIAFTWMLLVRSPAGVPGL